MLYNIWNKNINKHQSYICVNYFNRLSIIVMNYHVFNSVNAWIVSQPFFMLVLRFCMMHVLRFCTCMKKSVGYYSSIYGIKIKNRFIFVYNYSFSLKVLIYRIPPQKDPGALSEYQVGKGNQEKIYPGVFKWN